MTSKKKIGEIFLKLISDFQDSHHPEKLTTWGNRIKEDSRKVERERWGKLGVKNLCSGPALRAAIKLGWGHSLWSSGLSSVIYRVVTRIGMRNEKSIRLVPSLYLAACQVCVVCNLNMKRRWYRTTRGNIMRATSTVIFPETVCLL